MGTLRGVFLGRYDDCSAALSPFTFQRNSCMVGRCVVLMLPDTYKHVFARCRERWEARFLVDPSLPQLGTWLHAEESEGQWTLRCLVCASHSGKPRIVASSAKGTRLEAGMLQQHELTHAHCLARRALTGCKLPVDNILDHKAPPRSWLQAVLDHRRLLRPNKKGVEVDGCKLGRNKVVRLTSALAETRRMLDRDFMQHAQYLTLHTDGKGPRILVTYVAVNKALETRRGVLGHAHTVGLGKGHIGIALGVKQVMRNFCTEGFFGPGGSNMPCRVDKRLLNHMFQISIALDADAASDEQLAAKILQCRWTPNAVVLKDHTHAARRLLTRPWAHDKFLDDILKMCVFGRHSVTQLIQHSHLHQETFRSLAADMEAEVNVAPDSTGRIKDLKSAKHRFESHFEPLSRICLFLPAYIMTAVSIAIVRKGKAEAKHAAAFLNWISEERLVALAMLADAAQHGLEFIRFWDGDNVDPSAISGEIGVFVLKAQSLFMDGKCTSLGHTHHMLKSLNKPIPIPKHASGVPLRSVGGVDVSTAVEANLKRLQCWVSMAIEVLQTEFPDTEFLQCFTMFALKREGAPPPVHDAAFQRHADRLALKSGLDLAKFTGQFEDVHYLAQYLYKTIPGISALEAWREALARKRRRWGAMRPLDEIMRGLQ
eukprot:11228356-Lingulodinium_polyedra.AAC.1